MAFGAEELHVLRRALALALHPGPVSAEDVHDCLRLADSVDEAVREGARLRAFLVDDLDRYRAALPGTVGGYLSLLEDVLAAGYQPVPDDLAALRALRGNPVAAALLERCRTLAERAVRARLAGRAVPSALSAPAASVPAGRAASVPGSRARLTALPGGLARIGAPARPQAADKPAERPGADPKRKPGEPAPQRPVPTPAEVFPPRRRPAGPGGPAAPDGTPGPAAEPPADPPQQWAAG
ncbi:hypothetical protein GT204_07330 [Streptomyces sp. SID4919]|nr:hypothetical protein [Streptomyces sp. SID4919]SCK24581.1 hypothetical protein YW7DRAFT_01847 [Streptomyces sp. AmelKG-E11A]